MKTDERKKTRVLFNIVTWVGVACLAYGTIVTLMSGWAFVQVRTGWGLTALERCCSELGVASIGATLGGMFFTLLGSAVILLLHPIRMMRAKEDGKQAPRWPLVLAVTLTVYALGVFALATSIAGMSRELEGFAPGLVTYCMLIGVGILGVAWGFKRASKA